MGSTLREKINYLVVCNLILCMTFVIAIRASESKKKYGPVAMMFDKSFLQFKEGVLRSEGYDVNDPEDIKRAAIESKSYVRDSALVLLAYKTGTKAIPVIKDALEDTSRYEVRCTAATLLGMFGDKSGLDRMRKDMAEFSKGQDTLEKDIKEGNFNKENEPYLIDKPPFRRNKKRYALLAANVLAEFGDCSGYELAAREAIENESAMNRTEAACALAWMCKVDEEQRKAKGLFPEDVLLIVAEKETESRNLFFLNQYIVGIGVKNEKLNRVVDKIVNSPHLSEKHKEHAERVIRGREIQRRYLEKMKKKKDPNENKDANKKK